MRAGDTTAVREFYYSDRWQVLEKRDGHTAEPEWTFVWGLRYADDLVQRDRARDTSPERLYATHDQWHVTAAVDGTGGVAERYGYRAFGGTAWLAPDFTTRSDSDYEWEVTYGAYRYDPESQLYSVRHRYLHAALGR